MAERRMTAKSVIMTDAFMDMPLTAQALYFHLLLRADDDGFLKNLSAIRREVGASNEDIQSLIDNKFLHRFESGVSVIRHWRVHNHIKKDRYRPSDCEEKALVEMDEANVYIISDTPCSQREDTTDTHAEQPVSEVEPDRIQTGTEVEPDRIQTGTSGIGIGLGITPISDEIGGCARAREDHPEEPESGWVGEKQTQPLSLLDIDRATEGPAPDIRGDPNEERRSKGKARARPDVPYAEIVNAFNATCVSLSKVIKTTGAREKAMRGRFRDEFHGSIDEVKAYFRRVEDSDLLSGRTNLDWRADFDWLFKLSNTVKVLEGKYDNRNPKGVSGRVRASRSDHEGVYAQARDDEDTGPSGTGDPDLDALIISLCEGSDQRDQGTLSPAS